MKRRLAGRAGSLAGGGRARRLVRRTQVRVYDEQGVARTLDAAEGRGQAIAAIAGRMLDRARG